jgi:hypothetical protein
VLFAALAGGMGWGIRGQYGHETGAMIAGALVSLTLVFLLCPKATSLQVARAVALGTVAMGIGGSMTYGETLGLTQNADVIGNWGALRWGLLGTAVKGGLWIGFAGLFLGVGLGGVRYRPLEMFLVMLGVVVACVVGLFLLNKPHDPVNGALPTIYFSGKWNWEAGVDLKARPEFWGALLCGLAAAIAYFGGYRKDRLARNMALWGVLGGALGFSIGQCFQAFHAWNPEVFKVGIWVKLDPHMNWWNVMETTFGTIMGAALGLGLWLNRRKIQPAVDTETDRMPLPVEWILLVVHLVLLFLVEFRSITVVDVLYDMGIIMAIIPIVAIIRGRWWPYLLVLPITLLPIAGKTFKQLVLKEEAVGSVVGGAVYVIIPLLLATGAAIWFMRQAAAGRTGREFTRYGLLFCTWLYFLLNFAFFRFPWPWADWTSRTPSGIAFTICTIGLTIIALTAWRCESVWDDVEDTCEAAD